MALKSYHRETLNGAVKELLQFCQLGADFCRVSIDNWYEERAEPLNGVLPRDRVVRMDTSCLNEYLFLLAHSGGRKSSRRLMEQTSTERSQSYRYVIKSFTENCLELTCSCCTAPEATYDQR